MKSKHIFLHLLTALMLFLLLATRATAQDSNTDPQSASLVINGKRLVTFYGTLDGLSPDQRVERAQQVLKKLASTPGFNIESLKAVDGQSGTDIVSGNNRVVTITELDAKFSEGNSKLVANDFILKAKYALNLKATQAPSAPSLAIAITFCIVGFLTLVFIVALISRLSLSVCDLLKAMRRTLVKGIKIQEAELISAESMIDMALAAIKFLHLALIFLMFSAYVLLVLQFFPNTRPISDALVESAKIPLFSMSDHIVSYLPKLFTLAVIGLITYCAIFMARFFFNALRDGSIKLADFDDAWAEPTYKLTRFIMLFFALVCALPYLPGWDTPAFKQLGLVVGVLISLSSSSAISNMVAGVVLTYTNAFRLGDRVRVADNIGDVIEKTLFVTRLRTPKGEIISIPNGPILSGTIINYSEEGKQGKLILHSTVTIGYDAPWRKVHQALLDAAAATSSVLSDPPPFVLQRSLDDFYVTYEINVYIDHPQDMLNIYSELHQNIQDAFFKSGLEIMSPHYNSLRDGNKPAIPEEFLPADFVTPSFRLSNPGTRVEGPPIV